SERRHGPSGTATSSWSCSTGRRPKGQSARASSTTARRSSAPAARARTTGSSARSRRTRARGSSPPTPPSPRPRGGTPAPGAAAARSCRSWTIERRASGNQGVMDIALLVLRVVVGGLFAGHGAQKLFGWFGGHGLQKTGGFFESLGFRPGLPFAFLAGAAELG